MEKFTQEEVDEIHGIIIKLANGDFKTITDIIAPKKDIPGLRIAAELLSDIIAKMTLFALVLSTLTENEEDF